MTYQINLAGKEGKQKMCNLDLDLIIWVEFWGVFMGDMLLSEINHENKLWLLRIPQQHIFNWN